MRDTIEGLAPPYFERRCIVMKNKVKCSLVKLLCALMVAAVFVVTMPSVTAFGAECPDCTYEVTPDYIKDREPE